MGNGKFASFSLPEFNAMQYIKISKSVNTSERLIKVIPGKEQVIKRLLSLFWLDVGIRLQPEWDGRVCSLVIHY